MVISLGYCHEYQLLLALKGMIIGNELEISMILVITTTISLLTKTVFMNLENPDPINESLVIHDLKYENNIWNRLVFMSNDIIPS